MREGRNYKYDTGEHAEPVIETQKNGIGGIVNAIVLIGIVIVSAVMAVTGDSDQILEISGAWLKAALHSL